MIREATRADDAGAFAVLRSAYPEFVTTQAGFTHRQVTLPPEARARAWVAVEEGAIVGWGRAFHRFEESGGSAQLNLSVAPPWRRRHIGSELLARILDHLDEAPRVFAFAAEDSAPFARRHGFQLTQTMRVSAVDPRSVATAELDRAEAELRPLVEVGPEETFAVDSVAALDVPADEPPDLIGYEQWVERHWHNPDFDLRASYAAFVDGRPVAVTYAAVDYPGARAANAFTGVLPEFRGRGLARLVKLAVIRQLAEQGVALLVTDNDERNAPMLAVNERLGFRPLSSHHTYLLDRSGNGLRASAGST
jgi:GNAT superfamily N-acetyltransferase